MKLTKKGLISKTPCITGFDSSTALSVLLEFGYEGYDKWSDDSADLKVPKGLLVLYADYTY